MAGRQYYINDDDADMLASLFEREIVNLEEAIAQSLAELKWTVQSARRAKMAAKESIDPRLPDSAGERLVKEIRRDRALERLQHKVTYIRACRAGINRMKTFGRRFGYDF